MCSLVEGGLNRNLRIDLTTRITSSRTAILLSLPYLQHPYCYTGRRLDMIAVDSRRKSEQHAKNVGPGRVHLRDSIRDDADRQDDSKPSDPHSAQSTIAGSTWPSSICGPNPQLIVPQGLPPISHIPPITVVPSTGVSSTGVSDGSSEAEDSDSDSDEISDDSEESEQKGQKSESARFVLDELDNDPGYEVGLEVVRPDHCEDAESDRSSTKEEIFARMNELQLKDSSDDEERERIYLKKKKRWSAGIFMRSHSDNGSLDDLDQNSRRLRRRIRGPRRGSLIFEDRGVEEPDKRKGPPSIPSNDGFTPDELPFWREQNMIDVQSESDLESESEQNVAGKQGNLGRNPVSQERLAEYKTPAVVRAPEMGKLDMTTSTNGEGGETDDGTTRNVLMEVEQPLPVHTRGSINNWLEATLANENTNTNIEWDYNDSASGPSSYAASVASVFSVTSLASSASDISKGSGYSAVQIATATKVLLSIFHEDEVLLSLYKHAIAAQNIGPERLERNLRRLFRTYAGLLEGEATERLEHLASRLVRAKSASLAKSIIEKLQVIRASTELSPSEHNNESSGEEDDDASSRPVNEDAFEDLVTFRQFLVESEAFKTFHNQLQAFVIPNLAKEDRNETMTKEALGCNDEGIVKHEVLRPQVQSKTWHEWFKDVSQTLSMSYSELFEILLIATGLHLSLDTLLLTRDHVLVNMGLLEPGLDQNKTRLRWRCVSFSRLE